MKTCVSFQYIYALDCQTRVDLDNGGAGQHRTSECIKGGWGGTIPLITLSSTFS